LWRFYRFSAEVGWRWGMLIWRLSGRGQVQGQRGEKLMGNFRRFSMEVPRIAQTPMNSPLSSPSLTSLPSSIPSIPLHLRLLSSSFTSQPPAIKLAHLPRRQLQISLPPKTPKATIPECHTVDNSLDHQRPRSFFHSKRPYLEFPRE
jgi:hypothetical protein